MNKEKNIDPLTLSAIEARLESFNDELCARTVRQAFSMPTARIRDISSAILDSEARILTAGHYAPIHAAGTDISLKAIVDWIGRENIYPDDFILANDPYITKAGHLPDWSHVRPIFYEGELLFYHFMRTHVHDSGGAFPSTYAVRPYDCHAEGLIIPPVKIIERGVIDEKLYSVILKNVRGASMVRADNLLIYESMKKCEERILDMVRRYGKDVVIQSCNEIMRRTEETVRKEISTWKAGVFKAERAADWDGSYDQPVWVRLALTVKPEEGELIFDFSDTDPLVDFINVPWGVVLAFATTTTRWALSSDIRNLQGIHSCIKVIVKDGTALAPVYPYSNGAQSITLGSEVFECCQIAIAQAAPKENCGATWARKISPIFSGKFRDRIDPRTNSMETYWTSPFNSDGGTGAPWGYDGTDGLGHAPAAGASVRAPIEVEETLVPYRWLHCEMLTDSAGDGQWRGGLGVHVEYLNCHDPETWRPLDCCVITGNSDGQKFPPHGLFGGTDGKRHELWIKRGDKLLPLRTMDTQYVRPGDIIGTKSGGGGGIGGPLDRDVEKVRWDVLNQYISPKKAHDIYGVVIDSKSFAVNYEATVKLRKKLKAQKKAREKN
ncbi:MAG: hypothetical protein A2144_02885 [Chloroflexi bacterium RBG_16_50_9]|nr:MAG: hypothetical protein A2144_02885 [Chloroflexi bacterium RBG_16_50_9]